MLAIVLCIAGYTARMRFNFGKNWQSYARTALNAQQIEAARTDFARLFAQVPLAGTQFLDIGFGQGLSICLAAEAGAHCRGIDIDSDNLEAARLTQTHFTLAHPPALSIGSILDPGCVAELGQGGGFDVVHSWGVLHHTGNMALALQHAAQLTKPQGHLVLAIYRSHWSSPLWHAIKWLYNVSPAFLRRGLIAINYWVIYVAKWLVTRQDPRKKERGMDFYHDVVDWVGGYPYEHASEAGLTEHMASLGFERVDFIPAKVPTGCHQFVFHKTGSA